MAVGIAWNWDQFQSTRTHFKTGCSSKIPFLFQKEKKNSIIIATKTQVVSSALTLLNACCLADKQLYSLLLQSVDYTAWIRGLLVYCMDQAVRKEVATSIDNYCATYSQVKSKILLRFSCVLTIFVRLFLFAFSRMPRHFIWEFYCCFSLKQW